MPDAIPAELESLVAAIEEVCAELRSPGEFRFFAENRWIRDVEFADDEHIEHMALLLDADSPLLAVYVIIRLPDRRFPAAPLAMTLARANYGLLPGCFEMDLEDNQVRYRSVLHLVCEAVEPASVAKLLARALEITKVYAPAFQDVVGAGKDPIKAIEEVERSA
jgi:hypothetical protein